MKQSPLRRWAKRLALVLVAVIGLVALGVGAAFLNYSRAANAARTTGPLDLKVAVDPAHAPEGRRIAQMKGCYDCHGSNLGGQVFVADPALGTFAGANLTKGKGGRTAAYTTEDWVRAIRYGVGPHGRALRFMPASEFAALSDEDLAKLISYLATAEPVDNEPPEVSPGPLAKILYALGKMPLLFSLDEIPGDLQVVESVKAEDSAAYGRYLAAACVGCHGPQYKGGPIPGVPPSWPAAADLTPHGRFKDWAFDDFKKVMTEGLTPDGRQLNTQFMPWKSYAAMTETELRALYTFLKGLPTGRP